MYACMVPSIGCVVHGLEVAVVTSFHFSRWNAIPKKQTASRKPHELAVTKCACLS